jgi:hypothetical protein
MRREGEVKKPRPMVNEGEVMEQKHSRTGIASLVLASIALILIFTPTFAPRQIINDINISRVYEPSTYLPWLVALGFLLSPISLGLGVADLFEKNRRRFFVVISIVLNLWLCHLYLFWARFVLRDM